MANTGANAGGAGAARVVLYAADLDELRPWIGSKDERRFQEAWKVVREESESEWEEAELQVLERLLRRMVFEGGLYADLSPDERYYLSQLLIDLFDEFGDPDALSDDLPLDRLLKAVDELPRNSGAASMLAWLARGRELGGDGLIWESGPVDEVLSYFGYVRRDEAARLVTELDRAVRGGRPSGLLKVLRDAAEECARAELDLVAFVG